MTQVTLEPLTSLLRRAKPESFASIVPAKRLPKKSGFAVKPTPSIEYQVYQVELKRRYVTDESELLLGNAVIKVPKTLHDPTGQTATKREVWDAFARAVCYCLISSIAAEHRGVNQLFLFDNNWNDIERLETNAWQEKNSTGTHQTDLGEDAVDIAWAAFKQCDVQIDWLDVPVIA